MFNSLPHNRQFVHESVEMGAFLSAIILLSLFTIFYISAMSLQVKILIMTIF